MELYNYNQFGEFMFTSPADESPLEPGVYLIPANATTIAPPVVGTNQVAIFENGTWSVKADYRGQSACVIDVEGFFLEKHLFVLGEEPNATRILANSPEVGIYKPKWNGTTWIQGEEPPIPEPSLEERNRSDIDYILLMQGL